jgi:hypothetical protein
MHTVQLNSALPTDLHLAKSTNENRARKHDRLSLHGRDTGPKAVDALATWVVILTKIAHRVVYQELA